jgi:hypothetical protein
MRGRLLAAIDLSRPGLEIGALDHPMATREMGPVEYVDRAPTAELRRWAQPHTDRAAIVEVDHVWGEQTLAECVGGKGRYAYVLSSHVIEHVPDLYGWLNEVGEVLEPGGMAGFIVPDKRFTFDAPRRTSTVAEMIDAYVRHLRRPDPRQVFDHHFSFRDAENTTEPDPRRILEVARLAHGGEYVDSHCWVFTPRSMLAALNMASRLDVLPFEIAALEPTEPGAHEFLLALRRLPDDMPADARRAAFEASAAAVRLPEEEDTRPAPRQPDVDPEAVLARLAAIESSTSWRITAPLRAAVDLLRGRRR